MIDAHEGEPPLDVAWTAPAGTAAQMAADVIQCAPGAVADAKRLVEDFAYADIDEGVIRDSASRIAETRLGREGHEGVRARLQKCRPDWAA
jgi:methylglutaconyl-CoA hydratase